MYNKETFWDNTQGTAKFLLGGFENMNIAVQDAINRFYVDRNTKFNFNQDGTAFFIRNKDYAIRVGFRWGHVGNCLWNLDMEVEEGTISIARIEYKDLKHWENKEKL